MKKLTVGLGLIFSGYAANSFAALPTGVSSRCDVTVPNFCGGFTFGLTGLYWRASSPELDFSVSYPNTTAFFDTSEDFRTFDATSHRIKHDFNWAWSANVGYIFPCSGNDVNLTYTHYDHDRQGDSREFAFPAFFPLSQVGIVAPFIFNFPVDELSISGVGTTDLGIEITFDGLFTSPENFDPTTLSLIVSPDDITRVAAKSSFENNTWDLDFGQTMNVGCNFHLRWFGGLRYSRLKQTLDVAIDAVGSLVVDPLDPLSSVFVTGSFTVEVPGTTPIELVGTALVFFDGAALVRDIVNQKSDFNGIGPRFGLSADYHLGGGFGITGSLSTSLLVGEVESSLRTRVDVGSVLPEGEAIVNIPSIGAGIGSLIDASGDAIAIGDFPAEFLELGFNHPDDTRIVPNIDAKIGLDWTYQFCNCSHSKLTIEAGYMVSHYFNAIDRLSVVEATAPEFRSRHTVDVSFDGPYVGVQVAL